MGTKNVAHLSVENTHRRFKRHRPFREPREPAESKVDQLCHCAGRREGVKRTLGSPRSMADCWVAS